MFLAGRTTRTAEYVIISRYNRDATPVKFNCPIKESPTRFISDIGYTRQAFIALLLLRAAARSLAVCAYRALIEYRNILAVNTFLSRPAKKDTDRLRDSEEKGERICARVCVCLKCPSYAYLRRGHDEITFPAQLRAANFLASPGYV